MICLIKGVTIHAHNATTTAPLITHADSDWILNFIKVCKDIEGTTYKFICSVGTTDCRFVSQIDKKIISVLLIVHACSPDYKISKDASSAKEIS